MARLIQGMGLTRYEADEYYKQALAAYNKKDMDAAIMAMEHAIELLPHHAEYYAARGFFYLEDGVIDSASEDFEQALALYAYESLAHFGRGVIAYQSKNWEDALAHFTDAYRADPNRPETLYYLGLVQHRRGENTKALNFMQKAQELFQANNDRRRTDAGKWVRQIEKLIKTK